MGNCEYQKLTIPIITAITGIVVGFFDPYIGLLFISLAFILAISVLFVQSRKTSDLYHKKTSENEKLIELGLLSAGVMHEIKNPINFIKNFTQTTQELIQDLKSRPNDSSLIEEIIQNLNIIFSHTERAEQTVVTILEQARLPSQEKIPCHIVPLLDEYSRYSFHAMRAKYPELNISIIKDYQEGLPQILMHRSEIGRVFLNIFNNAYYALHRRKINTKNNYLPEICISVKAVNGKIAISIKDNGEGMDKATQEKIFDPLFTTKPNYVGTGLGLHLVKKIISEHHGNIVVNSIKNQFTEFLITLPLGSTK